MQPDDGNQVAPLISKVDINRNKNLEDFGAALRKYQAGINARDLAADDQRAGRLGDKRIVARITRAIKQLHPLAPRQSQQGQPETRKLA